VRRICLPPRCCPSSCSPSFLCLGINPLAQTVEVIPSPGARGRQSRTCHRPRLESRLVPLQIGVWIYPGSHVQFYPHNAPGVLHGFRHFRCLEVAARSALSTLGAAPKSLGIGRTCSWGFIVWSAMPFAMPIEGVYRRRERARGPPVRKRLRGRKHTPRLRRDPPPAAGHHLYYRSEMYARTRSAISATILHASVFICLSTSAGRGLLPHLASQLESSY
jgi:hypothetical protein